MTACELDEWSLGAISGLCRVLTVGDPATHRREYPAILAGWVHIALRRIERKRLDCDPRAIAFAKDWLKSVGALPKQRKTR